MRKNRKSFFGAMPFFLALCVLPSLVWAKEASKKAAPAKDPQIEVRVAKEVWTYTHKQLLEMATTTIPNLRGTRKKPAIPLSSVLYKDTGLSPEQVESVTVITDHGMPTVLQGKDLVFLDKLVLTSGTDKGKFGHPWSMAPINEKIYKKLHKTMGSRRRHGVIRIDIVRKPGDR